MLPPLSASLLPLASPAVITTAPPLPPSFLSGLLPRPAVTKIPPPTFACAVVSPADTTTLPPSPVSPGPTRALMLPPWPPLAVPVSREMDPVLPALDVPVSNQMSPLTPLVPAFCVNSLKWPLEVWRL